MESLFCETDAADNAIILSHVLKDRYTYEEVSYIDFSVENIRMPSSIRPTGAYVVEFLAKVEGEYKLVDTATVYDMLRALPGGLLQVRVTPELGTTYTEDTFTFSFLPGHKILQGGYFTIEIPPELTFVSKPQRRCLSFSALVEKTASCEFVSERHLKVVDAFKEASYTNLNEAITVTV